MPDAARSPESIDVTLSKLLRVRARLGLLQTLYPSFVRVPTELRLLDEVIEELMKLEKPLRMIQSPPHGSFERRL